MGRMPERMCVGCRHKGSPEDLLRVVAVAGGLAVDPPRTAPGRGAYLHPDPACLARAVRTRALGRALRTEVGVTDTFVAEFTAACGGAA